MEIFSMTDSTISPSDEYEWFSLNLVHSKVNIKTIYYKKLNKIFI